jgi:hypothetical protein
MALVFQDPGELGICQAISALKAARSNRTMRHSSVIRTWVRRCREWQMRGRHRAVGLMIGLRVMVFVRPCFGPSLGKHDGLRDEKGQQQQ